MKNWKWRKYRKGASQGGQSPELLAFALLFRFAIFRWWWWFLLRAYFVKFLSNAANMMVLVAIHRWSIRKKTYDMYLHH